MKCRVMKFIQYSLLVCLLFVSSFGVVMARYQISHSEDVKFKVRGVGSYYVENVSNQWSMNFATGYLESEFSIYNYSGTTMPDSSLNFHVRVHIPEYISEDIFLKLKVQDIMGNNYEYDGKYVGSYDEYREYVFVEDGHEFEFELLEDVASYLDFMLCATNVDDAFLSEVEIVDAGYDVKVNDIYSASQYYPLEISSNLLSKVDVHNVMVNEDTTISMVSNMGMYSEVSCIYEGMLLFPHVSEESLYLPSGVEQSVMLSWSLNDEEVALLTEQTIETITVLWKVMDDAGTVMEQWSANFLVNVGPVAEVGTDVPTITMKYIDEKEVFSQLRPLQCEITSNKDYLVYLIENDFLAGTRYSLDKGNTWYVLVKDGGIPVQLLANIPQEVIIEPKLSNWETNYYNLNVDCNGKWETHLQFLKKNEVVEAPLLISQISSGNIKNQVVKFTVNKIGAENMSVESLNMTVEYLNNGKYETIANDLYFSWTIENTSDSVNYTLSYKENIEIPNGTYRVKLQHKYSNSVVDEQYVSFFVKNY